MCLSEMPTFYSKKKNMHSLNANIINLICVVLVYRNFIVKKYIYPKYTNQMIFNARWRNDLYLWKLLYFWRLYIWFFFNKHINFIILVFINWKLNLFSVKSNFLWLHFETFFFQIKAKLQPVGEETTACPESPCLPDGLSPFKRNFPDLIKCMSPSRKRKSDNEASSTPQPPVRRRKRGVASISDDHTSTPVKRFTRQTRPISESEYSQVGVPFTIYRKLPSIILC